MSRLRLLPLYLLLSVFACSNDDDPHVGTESACADINEVCHDADDGSDDLAAECHLVAHDNEDAVCRARRQECVDFCTAKVQGNGGAGGQGGQGGQGGADGHDHHH